LSGGRPRPALRPDDHPATPASLPDGLPRHGADHRGDRLPGRGRLVGRPAVARARPRPPVGESPRRVLERLLPARPAGRPGPGRAGPGRITAGWPRDGGWVAPARALG